MHQWTPQGQSAQSLEMPAVYEINTFTILSIFFLLKALAPEITLTTLILKTYTRQTKTQVSAAPGNRNFNLF